MFGNITIFGITFYTTGTSLLAMIIILPIAAIIINKWTKNRCQNLPQPLDLRSMRRKVSKRIGLFALILFIALFWDVVVTGLRVHWLCKKEGGLHVYRTVEAEGFLGSGFKEWLEYGFQHIEEDEFGQKYRLSMENGKIRKEKVDSFISRYELVGPERLILSNLLSRERYYVKNRETGLGFAVCGEAPRRNAAPGARLREAAKSRVCLHHCTMFFDLLYAENPLGERDFQIF